MSDEVEIPEDEDDDDNETHSDGDVVFVGPKEFIEARRAAQEQAHVQALELRATVERLIDELGPEHCYALMELFAHIAQSGDTTMLHYITGQLSAIMRIKHKACVRCGSADHETPLHGFNGQADA